MVDTILKVGKDLFGGVSNVSQKRIKRNEKVANYFSDLAKTIEDTSAH